MNPATAEIQLFVRSGILQKSAFATFLMATNRKFTLLISRLTAALLFRDPAIRLPGSGIWLTELQKFLRLTIMIR
jgi:hypothetical protein